MMSLKVKNILLVNTYYYPEIQGGAEYSVKKLAEALTQKGHKVLVLSSAKENMHEVIEGVNVQRVKFHSIYHSYGTMKKCPLTKLVHRILDFKNPFNKKLIEDVLKAFKPDVVHTNNLYEITPEIWKVAYEYNIPVIHTIRDYYLMCPKATLMKKNNEGCGKESILCRSYQDINRKLTRYVRVLTAPSSRMISYVIKKDFFKNSIKQVVYNAFEFDLNQIEESINLHNSSLNQEKVTFVYLGSFFKHKGIEFLINAFCQLNNDNARLILAGKGPEQEIVEQACKANQNILYAGFLEQKEIDLLLQKCDILICPSLWNEPFGRVVLDAYKNGLPVIACNVGAMPEIIDNEKTGILVQPNNIQELIGAMNRFMEDKSLLIEFRSNLINKLTEFSIDKQVECFEDLYNKLG